MNHNSKPVISTDPLDDTELIVFMVVDRWKEFGVSFLYMVLFYNSTWKVVEQL